MPLHLSNRQARLKMIPPKSDGNFCSRASQISLFLGDNLHSWIIIVQHLSNSNIEAKRNRHDSKEHQLWISILAWAAKGIEHWGQKEETCFCVLWHSPSPLASSPLQNPYRPLSKNSFPLENSKPSAVEQIAEISHVICIPLLLLQTDDDGVWH